MEIPLPQSMQNEDNIFSYGFDGNLNRSSDTPVIESNVEKTVQDVLANSGINLNTTLTPSSGGSGNFERNDFLWSTVFESIDGYNSVGATCLDGGVTLETAAIINDFADMKKTLYYSVIPMTWNKNRKLRCVIKMNQTDDCTAYIGIGSVNDITDNFLGFRVTNNYLYAYSQNALGSQEKNIGLQSLQGKSLEVRHIAGVRDDFYVNNVFKCSLNDYVPKGTNVAMYVVTTKITTPVDEIRSMNVAFWEFWQSS